MSLFKTAWVSAVTAISTLLVASAASAAGGTTIKTAPFVDWGKQTFGDTSKMPSDDSGYKYEWWKVHLIAGDHLTIKFQEASTSGSFYYMQFWPAGTDDFSYDQTNSNSWRPNSNGKAQADYDATASGDYPIAYVGADGYAGAFDFTATIQHKVRLTLSASRIAHKGALAVGALYPDGSTIDGGLGATLYALWSGTWHKVGQGAVTHGSIKVSYVLPTSLRGQRVKLAVNAGGPSFKGLRLTRFVTVA